MKHSLLPIIFIATLVPATATQAEEQAPRGWLLYHSHPHGPIDSDRTAKNGTAVYGWSYRAASRSDRVYRWRHCGDYHYWDGGNCVDARDTPPVLQ